MPDDSRVLHASPDVSEWVAPNEWATLFGAHTRALESICEVALRRSAEAGEGFDGIVFHAGSQAVYHRDDQTVPFRSAAHFARWAPVPGPNHLVVYRPGVRPQLIRVVPRDYWHGAPEPGPLDSLLGDSFDVCEVESLEAAGREMGSAASCAYLGNAPEFAIAAGFAQSGVEPAAVLASLDWDRASKTDYEIGCLREAARRAGLGHAAVRTLAGEGTSERRLNAAYLEASGQLDSETPYPNIIAWNEASAVLHYEARRHDAPKAVRCLLIDAGAAFRGYASDITRTYAQADAHPVFRELVEGMERLQAELVAAVRPGSYVAIHEQAAFGVAELLCEVGVLRLDDAGDAAALGLDLSFFPHGVGHHLGLQVHDVGGHQLGAAGGLATPPATAPSLRTTRALEERHVVTIEPGLYFIPMLLDELRAQPAARHVDWSLVEALVPCGGIRVEDDVLVTATGAQNLSRPFVPGAMRP
jgi:Xaa-Pro dipeptidase